MTDISRRSRLRWLYHNLLTLYLQHLYLPHSLSIWSHYCDVIMSTMTFQITSLIIIYSNVYSADQGKHQSSASLAFVRGIHRWPVNSPHKRPVTREVLPFDDVIMFLQLFGQLPVVLSISPQINFKRRLLSMATQYIFAALQRKYLPQVSF